MNINKVKKRDFKDLSKTNKPLLLVLIYAIYIYFTIGG